MHTCHVNSQVIRFILSVSPGKEPAAELVTENIEHQDLLFLPVDKGTRKGYNPGHNNGPSNLLERVQAFMRWTTASCTESCTVLMCSKYGRVVGVVVASFGGGWVGGVSHSFAQQCAFCLCIIYIYMMLTCGANIPMCIFCRFNRQRCQVCLQI